MHNDVKDDGNNNNYKTQSQEKKPDSCIAYT